MPLYRKTHIFMGFLLLIVFCVTAQDQRIADSLVIIYKADSLRDQDKLELLRNLSFNENRDINLALKYAEELISLSAQLENSYYEFHGNFQKGNAKQLIGNLEEALAAYFRSAEIAKSEKLISLEGSAYGAIADIYAISDNHTNAMFYYNKAIGTLRKTEDTITLASYILNAGDALLTNKKYDSALVYFKESGDLFEEANYDIGKAYNLGNIGMVYANTGKSSLAEDNINAAIKILEESGDYYPISIYLMAMSDIYVEKKDHKTALSYTHRSLKLGTKYRLKDQIADANLKLSELYEVTGNTANSLKHYKDHVAYRDSVNNIATVQSMADQRTDFEVAQKQTELDLVEQRRKNQQNIAIATAITTLLIGFLAFGLYRRNKFIQRTKKIIEEEKDRSDNLLLNILPEETAQELKETGKVKAKKYDSASILFTDFKGFTTLSKELPPEDLVKTIGLYFSKFDSIIEKHGLEKIKTIGDAYMCVGGLHGDRENHAERMILAAFDIAAFVAEAKKTASADKLTFDIRIGINTGPVVAGVVGTRKFAYDIWGDSVNVAARMESNSEPGKINISEDTYKLIKDKFECQPRGELAVKNRGKMKMYFVNAIKSKEKAVVSVQNKI